MCKAQDAAGNFHSQTGLAKARRLLDQNAVNQLV